MAEDLEHSSPTPSSKAEERLSEDAARSQNNDHRNSRFRRYLAYLKSDLIESRGIRRVEPEERHDRKTLGYTQITLLWVLSPFEMSQTPEHS